MNITEEEKKRLETEIYEWFLIHARFDANIEHAEDGSPYAKDYIDYMECVHMLATKYYNSFVDSIKFIKYILELPLRNEIELSDDNKFKDTINK